MNRRRAQPYRNDLLWGVAWCLGASAFVIYNGTQRLLELFATPGAVSARAPLPAQSLTAEVGDGIPAFVDSAVMTVPGVNTVSVVCLVLGVVLSAIGLIGGAVLAAVLCVRMLRGIIFDRINTRVLSAISISLACAAICDMGFRTLGLNGVFAAAGGEFNADRQLFFDQLPLLGVAFGIATISIVFRRGAALQRDTEGLV